VQKRLFSEFSGTISTTDDDLGDASTKFEISEELFAGPLYAGDFANPCWIWKPKKIVTIKMACFAAMRVVVFMVFIFFVFVDHMTTLIDESYSIMLVNRRTYPGRR
jgi:hypothetical protein